MAVNAVLSDDELNILSTALANLCNTRTLCKITPDFYAPEKTKFRFLCSDGVKRRLLRRDLIALFEKISACAGHELGDVRGLLEEVGLR